MLTHDVMEVLAGGGAIVLGVALVALFGRDPAGAGEHTVDGYRPTLAPARRDWPLLDRSGQRRLRPMVLGPGATVTPLPLPWVPAAVDAPAPLYAECVVAQVVRRYGDSPADRAARMLREIAAEQRALAVAR